GRQPHLIVARRVMRRGRLRGRRGHRGRGGRAHTWLVGGHRRRHRRVPRRRRGLGGFCCRRWRRGGGRGLRGGGCGRGGCLRCAALDHGEHGAHVDRGPCLYEDLGEHPGGGRRHFHRHLVGL